jgi:hypothetical protein
VNVKVNNSEYLLPTGFENAEPSATSSSQQGVYIPKVVSQSRSFHTSENDSSLSRWLSATAGQDVAGSVPTANLTFGLAVHSAT